MMNFQINDGVLSPNRSIRLIDFLNGSGINLEEISQVQFVNLNPTSESGYFRNNQNDFERSETITIPSEDLTSTSFQAGSRGSDRLSVRVMVNEDWSDWQSFSVQVANVPPVVFTSDLSDPPGTRVKISDYLTVSDANNDNISHLRIHLSSLSADSNLYFIYHEDMLLPSNQTITISRESLADVEFQLADLSTGNEKIWVSAFDGQTWGEWSAINIYPERTDRPPDLNFIGAYHQKSSNSNGQTIETRIPLNGDPDLWINEQRITNDSLLQFDPQINEKGDVVWAEYASSGLYSKINFGGGVEVEQSNPLLNYQVQLSEDKLYYLSSPRNSNRIALDDTQLTYHQLDDLTQSNTLDVSMIPINYLVDDNHVVIVGLEPETGDYQLQIYNPDLSENTFNYKSENPLLASSYNLSLNSNRKIIEIEGSENLKTLFLGIDKILNDQPYEAFSYGSNNQGGLAWTSTYRIAALRQLAEKTNDDRIKNRLTDASLAIIDNANPDGLYPSQRYSLDSESPLSWPVHTGFIYSELLKTSDFLNEEHRSKLVTQAQTAYESIDKKWWDGSVYRSLPGLPLGVDGIQNPWNMQGAMGLMASELYKITGDPIYRERVEILLNNFLPELENVDAINLWHYWPNEVYEGWNWGERISANNPVRAATSDQLYEDYSHAYLTASFIREASEVLGKELPINFEAIGQNLEVDLWSFSRFISGNTSRLAPSLDYIPFFVEAENIASYYREVIPRLHSSGLAPSSLTRAYAQLVSPEPELGESLIIREYSTNPDGIVLESEHSLGTYQEILDYHFNLINTPPTVNVNQSNLSWNNGWLQASDIIEVTDNENDPVTHYRVWHPIDDRGDLYIAEQLVEAEGTIPITAAEFSSTWIHGDLVSSSNPLWVQAYDGNDWSTWVPLEIDLI